MDYYNIKTHFYKLPIEIYLHIYSFIDIYELMSLKIPLNDNVYKRYKKEYIDNIKNDIIYDFIYTYSIAYLSNPYSVICTNGYGNLLLKDKNKIKYIF